MIVFANTREFKVALLETIHYARRPSLSRHALAEQLEGIADKLGATPRKKREKKKTPPVKAVPARELVNVGQGEASALKYFSTKLDDALNDLKRERSHIQDAVDYLYDNAKQDEREVSKEEVLERWNASSYFSDTIAEQFKQGLDHLVSRLEDHAPITHEDELFESLQSFLKKFPKDAGGWPEGKGEKLFDEVEKAILAAKNAMPNALVKPSELGRLRVVLESIADAMKLMTGKSYQVPKIPNALQPEDPRQLGFGFTASRPQQAHVWLDFIWKMASARHPSRAELAETLYATAIALRP